MLGRLGRTVLPLFAGALALTACESSGGLTAENDAKLTIQLTDAPGDLKEAWVKIDRLVLQGTVAGDSSSSRQEFTPTSTGYVNLLTLAGGKLQDLVSGVTVKPGTYQQLRVVVKDAYVRTHDNRVFATSGAQLPSGTTASGELVCPGCSQSGFKVNFPGGVTIDPAGNTLLIDFDVKQSFGHEAGKSGKFILKPVLHGIKTSTTQPGRITGSVALAQGVTLPACGGQSTNDLSKFVPTAKVDTTTRTGTTVVSGGTATYTIAALRPGSYTLGVAPVGFANGDTLTFTAAATPASVTVASGATATAGYTVSAAACKVKG